MTNVHNRVCSVEGCARLYKCRGWCGTHYARWLRHGHIDSTRISGSVSDYYTPTAHHECWPWRGSFNSHGYGRYGATPAKMAHRLVYERHRGHIPDGLVLDHLCRNTACVNPWHLEPVEQVVNMERGLNSYVLSTTCRNGLHDITSSDSWYVNTYGNRTCLACKRENDRRAESKRRGRRTRG